MKLFRYVSTVVSSASANNFVPAKKVFFGSTNFTVILTTALVNLYEIIKE
jgi:hypothetical protein